MNTVYRENILELWKNPENYGEIKGATKMRGFNSSCGDDVTIYLKSENGKIKDLMFTGKGCALCIASSSILTTSLRGKSEKEVLGLSSRYVCDELGVDVNPARLKCVLLPLETIQRVILESNNEIRI